MAHCTCGSGASWCARTDEIFGVDGVHVVATRRRGDGVLVLDVETDQTLAGCRGCGVVATGHGRRVHLLHDTPCFGRPVLIRWRKRIWRCEEPTCEVDTWSETHDFAKPRSKLTARARNQPFMLIGSTELTLEKVAALGTALLALADETPPLLFSEQPEGALPVLHLQLAQNRRDVHPHRGG